MLYQQRHSGERSPHNTDHGSGMLNVHHHHPRNSGPYQNSQQHMFVPNNAQERNSRSEKKDDIERARKRREPDETR